MDFKQLEAFVYTVENKSFSEAANKLFLSQPTISSHISSLEKELNKTLISRTTKQFILTEAGQQLYEHGRSMLALRKRTIEELSDEYRNTLTLGASTVPATYLVPEVVCAYRKSFQNVRVHVSCSDSLEVINRVSDRSLDIGFVGTRIPDNGCIYEAIARDELVVVTPNNEKYQAIDNHNISVEDLLNEPMIIRESDSGTQIETEQFLSRLGIKMEQLNIVAMVNNPEVIKGFIVKGGGISIMSRKMVQDEVQRGLLLTFPSLGESMMRTLYMVYRKEQYQSKAVMDFIDLVKSEFVDLQE